MKRVTAFVDRLLVALIGAVLLAGGCVSAAWHYRFGWARTLISRFDRTTISELPQQSWWHGALIGVALASAILGLFLLIGNLAPRRTHTLRLATSHPNADVTVDLDALAVGIARELKAFPGVYRTRAQAIDDRGLPTISITVRAYPEIDLSGFAELAEARASYVASALGGARTAMRVQLHIEPEPAVQTSVTTGPQRRTAPTP